MTEVVALVLTHNSSMDLAAAVAAVQAQSHPPSRIVVIDSASRPPAVVPEGVELIYLEENLGPAGGHARGLQTFLAGSGDAAWILDDDMIPAPDCLAELLVGADANPASLVLPAVRLGGLGEPDWYPAWCGVLLARSVVERIGLPRTELFWWAEDTEYLQWRTKQHSVPTVRAPAASVTHRRSRAAAGRPAWKVYYEARNTLYYRLRIQGMSRHTLERATRALGKLLSQVVVHEDDKARKLVYLARGIIDGLLGRLGIRVPVPDGTTYPRTTLTR